MSDPINFPLTVSTNNIVVELQELVEICQGGPVIGRLFINKRHIHDDMWFGGPIYIYENYLFLTKRHKSFLFNGFKICKINLFSNELFEFDIKADLIWITEVLNRQLIYQTSLDLSAEKHSIAI